MTASDQGPLHYDVTAGVATLTLDNPPLNVFTLDLTRALEAALDQVERDGVRAVILTGGGDRAFCAGSDISEFSQLMSPGQVVDKKLGRQNELFTRIAALPVPTIAALNGLTYGGGLEIAVCCDLLVAEEHARIALPEIKLGVFPGTGGTWRVARRIGHARAKEMMLLGEPIEPATALDWGLVNRVLPRGGALAEAERMARTLTRRPPYAMSLCKSLIDDAEDLPEDELTRRSLRASDKAFTSPECREGVRAFFAKEEPDFDAAGE